MHVRNRSHRTRRGVTLAECGVCYSAAMLLIIGTIVVGMGVYRAQLVSALAREGARWASVHGPAYQSENSAAAPTSDDVLANAITPMAIGLNSANLTCALTMTSQTATVTVTYQWIPEVFFSPVTLTSTSVMPISF